MSVREIIGKLTIEENVNPIERNKIPNTLVIHIPNPLASYFSRFSQINKPNSVLMISKKPTSFERILRATNKINAENDMQLAGAKCEITLGKNKYSGIRVKGIQRYSDIERIQKLYQKEGFEFAKSNRLKRETNAVFRVNKFFKLEEVAEGIYQSPNNKDRYYIVIPRDLSWEEFRDVTFDIKNNISVSGYDVAKGIFYEKDGITEMIRIIKPNLNLETVQKVHKKYLERLSD